MGRRARELQMAAKEKGFQWDDTRAFHNPFDDYKPTESESQVSYLVSYPQIVSER